MPALSRRSQPRLEKIKTGERDMADALAHLRTLPQFNGRAAAMGFCYGGPYAILGPKRLGYAAGISCHGTQMLDYIGELDGVTQPVCIIWGDHRGLVDPIHQGRQAAPACCRHRRADRAAAGPAAACGFPSGLRGKLVERPHCAAQHAGRNRRQA